MAERRIQLIRRLPGEFSQRSQKQNQARASRGLSKGNRHSRHRRRGADAEAVTDDVSALQDSCGSTLLRVAVPDPGFLRPSTPPQTPAWLPYAGETRW